MSDDLIAILVCVGVLAALCAFSALRRSAGRSAHSYGQMYQPEQKSKDEHLA